MTTMVSTMVGFSWEGITITSACLSFLYIYIYIYIIKNRFRSYDVPSGFIKL